MRAAIEADARPTKGGVWHEPKIGTSKTSSPARWTRDPVRLPERFGGLPSTRSTTPSTRGWRTAGNMPMIAKLVLPIVGAAAVLVLAVLAPQQLDGWGPGTGRWPRQVRHRLSQRRRRRASPNSGGRLVHR